MVIHQLCRAAGALFPVVTIVAGILVGTGIGFGQDINFSPPPPLAAAQVAEPLTAQLSGEQSIVLPGADAKLVNRLWSIYVRNELKGKLHYDRKTKTYQVEGAQVRSISPLPVNLSANSQQVGNSVSFTVVASDPPPPLPSGLPEGQFTVKAAPRPRFMSTAQLLQDFGRQVRLEQIRLKIKAEELALHKIDNEIRRLQLANQQYHREIQFAEDRIRKAKANLVKNAADQQTAQQRRLVQQKAVEAAKGLMATW